MWRTLASDRAYLALIAASAAWGIGTVISKRAVEEIPPLALLPIQLASSLALFSVLLVASRVPFRDPTTPPALERLGILNPGLSYALGLLGLVSITASLAVLIWAMEPLLILLLAGWFLGERVGPIVIALSLVAAVGVGLVVYDPASTGSLVGVGLTVAGVLCCAIYSTAARRLLEHAHETASVVAAQQAYALAFAVVLAAVAWAAGGALWPADVSGIGLASAAVSGILYYGFAYWMYLWALRRLPASIAAASFYLIPLFGLLGSYIILDERLTTLQSIGAVVVLVAVVGIARLARSRDDPDRSPATASEAVA
jgi:probable blue pigment (indigoidine) exporter